jgi:hypothetical protein
MKPGGNVLGYQYAPGRHADYRPGSPEHQAARLSAFAAADPAHVDQFARVSVSMWAEIAQGSESDWTAKIAQAARAWAAHRGALEGV